MSGKDERPGKCTALPVRLTAYLSLRRKKCATGLLLEVILDKFNTQDMSNIAVKPIFMLGDVQEKIKTQQIGNRTYSTTYSITSQIDSSHRHVETKKNLLFIKSEVNYWSTTRERLNYL